MVTITLSESGPSKGDLVEMAYEECGSSGFEFERTPEEIASGLRKLNAMMREWPWNQLSYVQPPYGTGLPSDLSGIADEYTSVVAQHLALRIAPAIGATLSPESRAALSRSLLLLQSQVATVPAAEMPGGTWRGAGSRSAATTPLIES